VIIGTADQLCAGKTPVSCRDGEAALSESAGNNVSGGSPVIDIKLKNSSRPLSTRRCV
jgi:hypothetical protein